MEDAEKAIIGGVIIVLLIFLWIFSPKDNVVGHYEQYDVIEINGHHYIKRPGIYDKSMVHDPDCPKCKEENSYMER